MSKKEKPGPKSPGPRLNAAREPRLARQSDVDHAAALARAFRSGQLTGDDLATMLEWFAQHRTFDQLANQRAYRIEAMRYEFARLRKAGRTYEEAIETCAEFFQCSETTARNYVKEHTAKT